VRVNCLQSGGSGAETFSFTSFKDGDEPEPIGEDPVAEDAAALAAF